jgi:phage-related protein
VQFILPFTNGIAQALPQLITMLPIIIKSIIDVLMKNLPAIIQAGIQIIIALIKGLVQAIPELIKMLPTIIETIIQTLLENISLIIDAGIQLLVALIEGLIVAIPQLIEAMPQIISVIWDAIKNTDWLSLGKSIVEGVWEGIKSLASWLWDQVTGFFSDIVDGVKEALGIHSPSKVFAEIGNYMAQGLGQGFVDQMSSVSGDIKNSIPRSFNDIGVRQYSNVYTGGSSNIGNNSTKPIANTTYDQSNRVNTMNVYPNTFDFAEVCRLASNINR